jgi:NAD(P)-dependent dehydrogenase (short-subunit alcohol dehydrogenase family)
MRFGGHGVILSSGADAGSRADPAAKEMGRMQDFEGRTAVITGAASGMGLAMAECFAREGMNVVLADVEKGALREAAARIEALGASALAVPTDVSDEAEMDHLGEATREAYGSVDVLCLNAGVAGGAGPAESLTTKDWKWALDVNVYGIIHGIRVFLGDMRARDQGEIVITASVAGLTSFPGTLAYNTSKHAAVTIAESLFSELAETGSKVRVHCLCPGLVATNIHTSARNRPKELTNDGQPPPTEEQLAALASLFDSMTANAKVPEEVAELVLAAIVEGRFWIQTDEFFQQAIRERHRSIEEQTDPPARGNVLAVYV